MKYTMFEEISAFDSTNEENLDKSTTDMGGEMSFCMSNYQRDVLKMMSMMQSSQMLTDITLEVGAQKFYSHKLILAAASPYFKAMFTGGLRESRDHENQVRLHGVCPTAMNQLLHFIYSGQIKVTEHSVCQLLSAAAIFQIADVLKACCMFLERQLAPANAIGIAKFAEQHGCMELHNKATHYILHNFTEVSYEEEFLQLDSVELIDFIRKDELNVKDETLVYDAVLRWIKYDAENRENSMNVMLPGVRCEYLSPAFIKEQMKHCEVINRLPACKEYLAQIFKELTLHKKMSMKERSPVAGRLVYSAGGYNRHSLDAVEMFNSETQQWTQLAKLTVPRSGLGGAFVQGVLYAIGGRNNTPGSSYDSDWVDRYDPSRDLWRPCNPMSCPRNRVGVAVLDGFIYACGGSAGTEFHNSVEKYDPDEDRWIPVAPMLRKRMGAGVAVVNRLLYAAGGYDGEERLKSCECYHPETNEWTVIRDMNNARSGAGVAVVGQYIYMLGGYDDQTQLSSVERYDTQSGCWSYVSPLSSPRSALAAFVVDGKIYAAGGFNQQFLSIVEVYDPETDRWSEGPSLSFARSGHMMCVSHFAPTRVTNMSL